MAEKERDLLKQRQKEQEQVMEAQERSFRENIAKLQEKMERERVLLLREQEEMLEHKLKVSVDEAWQSHTGGTVTPREASINPKPGTSNTNILLKYPWV